MTNFLPPTNTGTRLKYGNWEILLFLDAPSIIVPGRALRIAYNDSGSAGWVLITQAIDGPYTDQQWTDVVAAAGGMGNYIVGKFPVIKLLLVKYFDTTPELPLITNSTPFSPDNFNKMLREWIELKDDPGTGHPTVEVRSTPLLGNP